MHRILAVLFTLAAVVSLAAQPTDKKDDDKKEPDKKKGGLHVGANLPGPFVPYNATGKYAGRFRSPVTEQDGDPTVLVFTRETEPGPVLKSLVSRLENVADKNRNTRLAAAVVFVQEPPKAVDNPTKNRDIELDALAEDDPQVVLAASLRESLGSMLKATREITKQNLVILCVSNDADLSSFELDRSHKATIVLYRKLEVLAVHDVEDLDDKTVEAVMKDVAEKFKAARQ